MGNWCYSTVLDARRREQLAVSPPFDVVAQRVAEEMQILCSHIDPCDEAIGFKRDVGCIRVDGDLFDFFFNSEEGYRGRYFASPEVGLAANTLLLGRIAEPLAHFATHS